MLKTVPNWILFVSALFALLELGVSLALFLSPASMIDTIDFSAKGVDYLVFMWAVRQLALGCILVVATIKRSAPMLTIAYIFLAVMFAGDLYLGISKGEGSLIITAVLMTLFSLAMLYAINRRKGLMEANK